MTPPRLTWTQFERISEDTVLVHCAEPLQEATTELLAALVRRLLDDAPAWLWDLTPGFGKLLVHYRPNLITPKILEAQLAQVADALHQGVDTSPEQPILIPVCYDQRVAPDLLTVAHALGLSPEAVAESHASADYRVQAVGFALGFAYMGGVPRRIQLPRKTTPSLRVPAGSVAMAGSQTTIYPIETPGGWHLIGRSRHPLVQLSDTIHLTLPLGARVRFAPISYAEFIQTEGAP